MGNYVRNSIVTNGLVFYLDAANRKSYPGSGTIWNNLAGNNEKTGSLLNSPVYNNSIYGGYFTLTGTNVINVSIPNLTTIASIEIIANIKVNTSKMVFGWYQYDLYITTAGFGYNTANADVYGISSTTVSNLGLLNNWKHYVFEMVTHPTSYTSNKMYINTHRQTLAALSSGESSSRKTFNNGVGVIGGWASTTEYRMPMDIGLFRVYNRILSTSEILQNYNSQKTRFDLK